METVLTTDVQATLAIMNAPAKQRGFRRMTWSRYSDFHNCYALYFLKSFNVSTRPTQSLSNDHFSFDGKMIQKVVEVFYKNPAISVKFREMIAQNTLSAYVAKVIDAVDHCNVMTMHEAKMLDITNFYEWAKTDAAGEYINEKLKEIEHDDYIRVIVTDRPAFCIINRDEVELVRGGKTYKSLLKEVVKAAANAVQFFNQWFPYERTGVEMWATYTHQGIEYCGMMDMAINRFDGGPKPKYMNHLQPNYLMVDGKRRINDYQTHEQLQFYSAIIEQTQRIRPHSLTLFDYTESVGKPTNYDPNYIQKIHQTTGLLSGVMATLQSNLKDSGIDCKEPWKLVPRSPSKTACRFCPAGQGHCELSQAEQLSDRQQYAKAAKEVNDLVIDQLGIGESGYAKGGEIAI